MAYKVFTNGSVLQASEINDNLMRQSVMVFSNASARTAAITSPIEGMLTWLEDLNRYEHYNGTSWVVSIPPVGLTLLNATSFSSAGGVEISNVFTSEFNHYKIFLSCIAAASGINLNLRFRNAGGNVSSNNYFRQVLAADGSTVSASRASSQPETQVGQTSNVQNSGFEITIYNPNQATTTNVYSANAGGNIGTTIFTSSSMFATSDVFTGVTLFPPSSTITGSLRIYGIRN